MFPQELFIIENVGNFAVIMEECVYIIVYSNLLVQFDYFFV